LEIRLGEIAAFLGVPLEGGAQAGDKVVRGIAPLESASPEDLSFLENPRYASRLADSKAGCILLAPEHRSLAGDKACLFSKKPRLDFVRVIRHWFYTPELPAEGIHPSAIIAPDAVLSPGCRIAAYVVVEAGAVIGPRSALFPFCYVGRGSRLGADCVLHPSAVVLHGCRLGDRVVLQPGAVVGSDGFGFEPNPPSGYEKFPQIGWVEVGDDVEIQANACVDRGSIGPTRIGKGAKLDNLVQVAHNVVVGEHTVMAAQSGISGSTRIGSWVTIAGQAGAAGHLTIGDQAILTAQAGAGKDIPAGAMMTGTPAQPTLEHHRGLAELNRIGELRKTVKELGKRLAELEKKLGGN
jgi:UDP-3-O-[3-hydroxymyristoyl] glucosamine N-acyltransferase